MADRKENRIKGRSVSRGVAIGTVTCVYGNRRQYIRRTIATEDLQNEVDRFVQARKVATAALRNDIDRIDRGSHSALSEILESHLLLLDDALISQQVQQKIETRRLNAEAAIQLALDDIASRFRSSSDEGFREKSLDLDDVAERMLSALGAGSESISLPPNAIIVAKEMGPATLLQLVSNGAVGLVAESGGWTSHTSILAREWKIPAITGIKKVSKLFRDGEVVVVDGYSGEIVLEPSESTITFYSSKTVPETFETAEVDMFRGKVVTLDGHEITFRTNTTSAESYRFAAEKGAKGIGLYRSESLISKFKRIPSEEEQVVAYVETADAAGEHGINIRTFDIDTNQFAGTLFSRQKNPALGLRAIRLGFENQDLLEPQIRALLRAASGRNIRIVIPMVTGVSEIKLVKQIIHDQEGVLREKGTVSGTLSVGAMIEIPSAVLLADQLAAETDFLCLGTNDLAQYLLAADRDNDDVSQWFRTLHPSMLKAVKQVIDACSNAGKPLIVCGEMAGSPFYVPVLIGLGATILSMNPGSIEAVRRVVAGIAEQEAVALVREIEELTTADEVENVVRIHAKENWPHLFAPGFLEMHGP